MSNSENLIAAESIDKLSKRNLWLYSTGGIGRDMAYNLFNGFMLSFILFTKSLDETQFAIISVIIIVCRIWDGINDPIMGGIVENTRTRIGKFKPWLLLGCVSNSVILILMFSVPLTGWGFIIFFGIMYLLWDITYTMNDIGYWAMLPSLTSNATDRNNLTSLANLFSGLGSILVSILIPAFTTSTDGSALGGGAVKGYAIVSVVIALCFVGCQLITFFGVVEKPLDALKKEDKIGFKKLISVIFKNDQLLWMACVLLMYNVGSAVITSMGANYIYFEYGYNGEYVSVFSTLFAVFSGVIMILYPFLSKKLSRKTMMRTAYCSAMAGYILILLVCSIWKVHFIWICIFGGLIGFGQSFLNMVITINLTNTIEYNEWKTGDRDEGIIFSVRPFMAKMGSAVQQLLISAIYLIIGVTVITTQISNVENDVARGVITDVEKASRITAIIADVPDSVIFWMRLLMVIIPIILLSSAYLILEKKCTISETKYNEMLLDIVQREAAAKQEESEDQATETL